MSTRLYPTREYETPYRAGQWVLPWLLVIVHETKQIKCFWFDTETEAREHVSRVLMNESEIETITLYDLLHSDD